MVTESKEHKATNQVLDLMSKWMKAGTNEGISFLITRLTDDLFTDSFSGGGDMSLFTPSSHRGTLNSQLSDAYVLDSGGGLPHKFAISLTFNLDTGTITGSWTNPVTMAAETPTIKVESFKSATRAEGTYHLFYGDVTSDDASYSLSFLLL